MPLTASLLLFASSELCQERNFKVLLLSPISQRQQTPCWAGVVSPPSWAHLAATGRDKIQRKTSLKLNQPFGLLGSKKKHCFVLTIKTSG